MSAECKYLFNFSKKSHIEWPIKLDTLQIAYDGRHFFMDLVFYNYLLKCFVLIIEIILCVDKSDSIVKYTLSKKKTQVFVSKYKLYLSSEEELLLEIKRKYNILKQEELGKDEWMENYRKYFKI